ncbi:MAG: TraB/GumN family protein [Candidatus Diapherotrites archaeon]
MDVERLKYGDKEIVLVGTAHVSQKSVELVEKVIEEENPDIVGIELDKQRFIQLKSGSKWQETDILKIIKTNQTQLFILNMMLASMQKKIGEDLGVKPGMEMLKAVEAAEKNQKRIILLDRDVRITLKRAINEMSIFEKLKMLYAIVAAMFFADEELTAEKVEELKKKDVMTELMNELGQKMPSIKKVLVDERDLFIANGILASPGKKIVAVVGAGHIDGIKKYLDMPRDISSINKVVENKSVWGSVLKYLIPALFVVILFSGFYFKGTGIVLSMVFYWIIFSGGLAALGALIGGAHPFAIATAFLAAPITTLHPALAAGWFVGLVEAKIRPPRVMDFENLKNMNSFSDFNKNRAMHILLVTAYANIGATIGVVIAIPYILSLIG